MKNIGKHKRSGGWRGSAAQIAIGRAALRAWNAQRHLAPKCTAMSKTTGMQCRQAAMTNGKCHYHGGKTPRGDQFHVTQWPNKNAPNAMEKLSRKLTAKQKEGEARQRRLRLMPAEERRRHDQWHKTHKPGSAKARAAARERLRQDRDARASILRIQIELAIKNGEGVFA